MSQSKNKRIRKLAEIAGMYNPDAPVEYKEIKHKKIVNYIDPKGIPQAVPVERIQLINVKTYGLKALKRHVENGRVPLPSLKELHERAAQLKAAKEAAESEKGAQ